MDYGTLGTAVQVAMTVNAKPKAQMKILWSVQTCVYTVDAEYRAILNNYCFIIYFLGGLIL